jgi:hypothetical protein
VFGIESEDTVAKYLTEQGCKDGFQVHHGSFASGDCAIMRQNPSKPTLFFAFNDLLLDSDTTTLWEHLWERQLSLSDEVAVVATSLRGITDEVFSQCTVEVVNLGLDPWKKATVSGEPPPLPEPITVTRSKFRDCGGNDNFPGQRAYYLTRNSAAGKW